MWGSAGCCLAFCSRLRETWGPRERVGGGACPVLCPGHSGSCLLRNNVLLSHGLHLRGQASTLGWGLGLGPRAGTQGVGARALGTFYSFERGAQQTSI